MTDRNLLPAELAERFEANRPRLAGLAYRMLGSRAEADDAVQEAWLRLARAEAGDIGNLDAWLTTVTARICLDMLRARRTRREDTIDADDEIPVADTQPSADPEQEALLADNVGLAMLIVLETLQPAERVAFVLHDMFDISFDEIASVVGRTTEATRQLASRARRRVRGADAPADGTRARKREVVNAFLAAARGGDFNALLALLDPDVVFRADPTAVSAGGVSELRGADAVARFFNGKAQTARPALVDGEIGAAVTPNGRLVFALHIEIADGRIVAISAVADPAELAATDLADLD